MEKRRGENMLTENKILVFQVSAFDITIKYATPSSADEIIFLQGMQLSILE